MFVTEPMLRQHVIESNRIERIIAGPSKPEYRSHLAAARLAADGIVAPCRLHAALARGVPGMEVYGGKLRTCGVRVGDRVMPHSSHVPRLMEEVDVLIDQYRRVSVLDCSYAAWLIHAHLLCVHPWQDGNGRTARLVWNMLRVSRGLPWLVQTAASKGRYYREIASFEKCVFYKQYPDVYEK